MTWLCFPDAPLLRTACQIAIAPHKLSKVRCVATSREQPLAGKRVRVRERRVESARERRADGQTEVCTAAICFEGHVSTRGRKCVWVCGTKEGKEGRNIPPKREEMQKRKRNETKGKGVQRIRSSNSQSAAAGKKRRPCPLVGFTSCSPTPRPDAVSASRIKHLSIAVSQSCAPHPTRGPHAVSLPTADQRDKATSVRPCRAIPYTTRCCTHLAGLCRTWSSGQRAP